MAASTGGNSSKTKYLPYYIIGNSGPLGLIFDRPLTAGRIVCSSLINATYAANSMIFMPLAMSGSILVDRLIVAYQSTNAGSILSLGIYTNSSDIVLYPFQSIVTSAIVSGSTNSITSIPINQVLSSNTLYWLSIMIGTASCAIRSIGAEAQFNLFDTNSNGNVDPSCGIVLARQFSNGMPISVETGGRPFFGGAPQLMVRRSA